MISESIFVYISGTGKTLEAIINKCYVAKVTCVVSSDINAPGLQYAKDNSIPMCIPSGKYTALDDLMMMVNALHAPTIIVLAGYMKILPPDFIKYAGEHGIPIVNIHPSLLPKYKGLNTHQRVLDNKDTQHGCTIHYVTDELDSGQIIQSSSFDVVATDTIDTLTNRVKSIERLLYPVIIDHLLCDLVL